MTQGKLLLLLTWSLKAVFDWERLQFNTNKTEWVWLFGLLGLRMLPSLVLDGAALPHSKLVQLVVLLDLQLLLKEWVVARRTFAQVHLVYQLLVGKPFKVIHALVTSLSNYCNNICSAWGCLQGLSRNYSWFKMQWCSAFCYAHMSLLLCELHCLPVRF